MIQLSAKALQEIEDIALSYHKTVEGEYGCPGLSCPGVQRLIEVGKLFAVFAMLHERSAERAAVREQFLAQEETIRATIERRRQAEETRDAAQAEATKQTLLRRDALDHLDAANEKADRYMQLWCDTDDQRREAQENLARLQQRLRDAEAAGGNLQRCIASIATMLGWDNVPPQETLEAEIRALKARIVRVETEHGA